ncbi:hypothetical protein P4O66_017734 [Electrophorus voltai]|uniref:Transposase Tc1-like domain-containing protein n=1 Tax=Electrophorus voltai TaxID=2609070 RepID=A0AAD8YSE5_9TELE|nr:hypothetical protein P4O66_017734 [Electrophorus voltai]
MRARRSALLPGPPRRDGPKSHSTGGFLGTEAVNAKTAARPQTSEQHSYMANMGKIKKHSKAIRDKIVEGHTAGKGYKALSKELDLRVSTVGIIIRKWKDYGTTVNLPWPGQPFKVSSRAEARLVQTVKADPRTMRELWEDLMVVGTLLSINTISNVLHRNGLHSRQASKVPLLSKCHVQACLKFAHEHLQDSEADWFKVLWSDDEADWFKVLWSDDTKRSLVPTTPGAFGERIRPQEYHPYSQVWWW